MEDPLFDIRTLLITLSVISFLLAVTLLLFSAINNNLFKGVKQIGYGLILLMMSYVLNGLQDRIPIEISIVFSLTLYGLSFCLIFYGFSIFLKKKPRKIFDLVFMPLYIAAVVYFTYAPNILWRISLISVMVFFYSLRISCFSLVNTPAYGRLAYKTFGVVFLTFGVAFGSRIVVVLISGVNSTTSFLESGNNQAVFLLLVIVFTIILTIFLIFLINLELLYMKDRFISILSHEVKNKFSAILGLSELLIANDVEDKNRIYNHIFSASREGYDNLNNLLEWSKNRFGIQQIQVVRFNLAEICNKIISDYSLQSDLKNILVTLNSNEKIELESDIKINELILRNLVSNAVKFTPENGNIIIDLVQTNNEIEIQVKDSGKGISSSAIKHILSNKSPGSTKGTNMEEGSGIGLLLAKAFIEQLGGVLKIIAVPNKGSVIGYSLPRKHIK